MVVERIGGRKGRDGWMDEGACEKRQALGPQGS